MSWVITGVSKPPLLLDTYSGAAAAYSLRSLSLAYGGSVVRVRRSSDNAEADFTAEQVGDGSLATWVGAGSNGFVRTWYDQSGNGRHGQQAASGSQPAIVTSGSLLTTSGKPKITFTSQFLSLGTSTIINDQSSIHAVLRSTTTTSGAGVLNYNSNPNDNPEIRYGVGDSINSYFNGGYTHQYNASLTTLRRLISQVLTPGVTDTLFVNGSQVGSSTRAGALSAGCSEFTLGRYVRANANRNGEIQELIVYTTGSAANRVAIEADINAHYAIY